jgi:hypothetical protein
MTHEGAQEVCGELGVVMILARNRWFHCDITLKSVISDVRSVARGITILIAYSAESPTARVTRNGTHERSALAAATTRDIW